MKKNRTNFYMVFSNISHTDFQVELHKDTICNAFLQAAEKFLDFPENFDVHALSLEMYSALFLKQNSHMRTILSTIHANLKKQYTLENFLSNYFYIVLNHYIKSFYTHTLGWKPISKFANAIEQFIDWSQSVDYQIDKDTDILSPEEKAISSLEIIREKKVKVTVLNTYHGVPIQYKASVVHTTANSVYLKVHPIQEAAAREQKAIYVLGKSPLEYDLFAQVKPVKYKGHTLLELKNLNILKDGIYQRQSVRVEPQIATQLQLNYEKLSYKVNLYDISLGGLAVITTKKLNIPVFASLKIKIPDSLFGKDVTFNAVLVQSSHFEESEKYHFKLKLTTSQETLLGRYINRRQNEIIHDLKKWI
jgi:hypothetical protein